MNYISANGLSKAYGDKVLFDNVSFGLAKGDKIALVGRNGCGKTSLLRILAGTDSPDSGDISTRNGIRIEFLDQRPDFYGAETVLEALFTGDDPVLNTIRAYEQLSTAAQPDPDRMQEIMDAMETYKAWDYESRVKEVLGKLGINRLDQPMSELSGGQEKRVALARVLVHEPDLLILDEPTNHLDTDTIEWLENHLSAQTMSLILVTHDRYFLDRVCNTILEIDRGEMFRYEGDYEHFLIKKDEREHAADAETSRARNLLRKELEWLRRQPKARTTKSKARIDSAHQLKQDAQGPVKEKGIDIDFKSKRLGSKILELEGVSKAFDGLQLVRDFSYVFKKGERIGIVGPNGVGKSTFLNLITGKLTPDSGEIETGQTIEFGYYTQEGLAIKPGATVLEVIKEAAEEITLGSGDRLSASAALTLFGFPPAVQFTQADQLSGGEKRRLHLLRVLMFHPNFLILDEPTNDLDIITLNTLEQFLMGFGGCLIIVSHDRYFLDKLCDQLFIFEGEGSIKPFPGTFREYRERKAERERAARDAEKLREEKKVDTRVVQREKKKKLSFNEKREYEALEGEIDELETKKAELEAKLNGGSGSYEELTAWAGELEALASELEAKSDRWLELAELAED